MLCNLVYAQITSQCADEEARKELDEQLNAPPGGWDKAEQQFWAAAMARLRQAGTEAG